MILLPVNFNSLDFYICLEEQVTSDNVESMIFMFPHNFPFFCIDISMFKSVENN